MVVTASDRARERKPIKTSGFESVTVLLKAVAENEKTCPVKTGGLRQK
jgi:hypothetical protein